MGLIGELIASKYLKNIHNDDYNEDCWVSTNRAKYHSGKTGDDTLGYDFHVVTENEKIYYEVKSTLEDSGKFILTANEVKVASQFSTEKKDKYYILYVPFVLDPQKVKVICLPNPLSKKHKNKYAPSKQRSITYKFKVH